jgi:hypothetical protein
VAFSLDGTRIVTGSGDRTAKVWDARSHARIVDGVLSPEEREYRLFWTRPRPDLHHEEYAKAVEAKDSFAADFHLGRLILAVDPKDVEIAKYLDVPFQRGPHTAARLFADAFAAHPKLADDLTAQHRYNAARYAVLTGIGQGKDARGLDDKERSHWRKQALDWLRADLEAYTKQLASSKPTARAMVRERLQHWQRDADMSGIREHEALAKLPAEERPACQQLWADVETMLKAAQQQTK